MSPTSYLAAPHRVINFEYLNIISHKDINVNSFFIFSTHFFLCGKYKK